MECLHRRKRANTIKQEKFLCRNEPNYHSYKQQIKTWHIIFSFNHDWWWRIPTANNGWERGGAVIFYFL